MDDAAFDRALIAAGFALAGTKGWRTLTVAEAARSAGLDLGRARARFSGKIAILLRFGLIADQSALTEAAADGTVRDRLFDLVMRRIDVLQAHREGVLALLRHLPADPALALLLTLATRRSMAWLLDAAGVSTVGLRGALRIRGLLAVWLWVVRAWRSDESADLASTMAALDDALGRAEQAEEWLPGGPRRAAARTSTPGAEPVEPIEQPSPPDDASGGPARPPPDTPPEIPPSTPGVM